MNLKDRLMISQLNISRWVTRTSDRKATKVVEKKYTTTKIGSFNKELVDHQSLKVIDDIILKARRFHNNNTAPWGENGERILLKTNFNNYKEQMNSMKAEYEAAVLNFSQNYSLIKEESKVRLNGLYNEADYPDNVESKFGMRVSYFPLPDSGDFRLDLSDDDLNEIRTNLDNTVAKRLEDAVDDVWIRIKQVVEKMVERLSDKDNIFKESLINNVEELIKVIPALNINDDPNLTKISNDMKALLQDPVLLRNNPSLRKKTADKANLVLNEITKFAAIGKRKIQF